MPKIIANYLPQYHTIPENDKWWGGGYTDWEAVKKSKPLFDGHIQPKEPLNKNYYDLSREEDLIWQAKLAREYGIYGFGIYHYWFSSRMMLLQKPAEIILRNPSIDINFMFIWDNSTWKRTWSNVKGPVNDWAPLFETNYEAKENGILAELIYGDEKDWEKHFEYLLPFFLDKRYVYEDDMPVFGIFTQSVDSDVLKKMAKYWGILAQRAGLKGIKILGRTNSQKINVFGTQFTYQPTWDGWTWQNQYERFRNRFFENVIKRGKLKTYSYDDVWEKILKHAIQYRNQDVYLSGFVNYDDTPRRGVGGRVIIDGTPKKFGEYFGELLKISRQQNKELIFLTAWNEWGEGAYLEPDNTNGYEYLEALKRAIDSCSE